MTSRDGLSFKRWTKELIPITAPKDREGNRSNYMTNGLLQLPGQNRELSVYATEAYYAGPGSRVRRFSIRIDGFVSVHADSMTSEFITKPFTFSGSQLKVNFLTENQGSMRFELQDDSGKPLVGYGLADCIPLVGDQIEHAVAWKAVPGTSAIENASVASIQNKPTRLRVEMQNADLFSIRFGPL